MNFCLLYVVDYCWHLLVVPFYACVWISRLSFCGTLVPTSEAWYYCFLMRLRSGLRYGPTLWECASNLPYLRPCPCCAETRAPLSDPKYLQAKQYWSDWMFSAYHLCQFEQLSGAITVRCLSQIFRPYITYMYVYR